MYKILLIGSVLQICYFLSTWKLYLKAEKKAWQAIVPIYSFVVLMRIINRPIWWVILMFVPVINLILFPVIGVEIARSFGKNRILDTWLTLGTFGLYVSYLNYNSKNLRYRKERSLQTKSASGEWVSSLLFGIVAATLVHTYIMQPFVIPSSSLEKSLLVGDFLLVSKIHYGARIPMTTLAAPMVHDTLPLIHLKSYVFDDDVSKKTTSLWNKFQLPYLRFPAFSAIKRNAIVVFNQPADTLLNMNDFHPVRNYYKPIDKKTNLVKRCVGIPGDSLEIRDGYVFVNGTKTVLPERAKPQYNYFVNTEGKTIHQNSLVNRYGARDGLKYTNGTFALHSSGGYLLTLTEAEALKITNNPAVKSVAKQLQPKGKDDGVFPHNSNFSWNIDHFGPIYIPKKGATITLDTLTLPLYKRIIEEYEGNALVVNGATIMLNGKAAENYTFKQDYYWMMGDNRQNSIDSRFWGYVPFDHVVGKPVFIWLSINKDGKGFHKIRWERLFTTVGGDGKPRSYFVYVLILILLYFGYTKFFKRKAKEKG